MVGAQHAYVLVRDWLGEQSPVDRDRALAELARRYLVGHGRPRTVTSPVGGPAAARRPRWSGRDRLAAATSASDGLLELAGSAATAGATATAAAARRV